MTTDFKTDGGLKGEAPVVYADAWHPCPICGKTMSEQKKWSGLWMCPDFKTPLNDTSPYKFKCHGMEIEERAAQAFHEACWEIIRERN